MKQNTFSTIISTFKDYKHYYNKVLPASLIAWGVSLCFVFFLIPFGAFASYLLFCILCVGLQQFNIMLLEGKKPKVEIVFSRFNQTLTAFLIKTLKLIYIFLWSLLFIVPGIICALNYAFSSHVFADEPKLSTFEVLEKSKKLAIGHRTKLFMIGLFVILLTLAGFSVSALMVVLIKQFVILPLWLNTSIMFLIFGLVFILVILPFVEISLTKCYLQAKNLNKTQKKVKNTNKEKESFDIITA